MIENKSRTLAISEILMFLTSMSELIMMLSFSSLFLIEFSAFSFSFKRSRFFLISCIKADLVACDKGVVVLIILLFFR